MKEKLKFKIPTPKNAVCEISVENLELHLANYINAKYFQCELFYIRDTKKIKEECFSKIEKTYPQMEYSRIYRTYSFHNEHYAIEKIYWLSESVLVGISKAIETDIYREMVVYYDPTSKNSIETCSKLISSIEYEKETEDAIVINVLYESKGNLFFKSSEFNIPYTIDLEKHYNDDFLAVHAEIENLIKKNQRGLVILNGDPGTGKTSYLKYLASQRYERDILLIPNSVARMVGTPSFNSLLKDWPNAILFIEEVEHMYVSNSGRRNVELCEFLDLTDGWLGDINNHLIFTTFNTDIKNIDPALIRPGRLKFAYTFKNLTVEKVNAILPDTNKEMPITDIFNKKIELENKTKKIGY